MRNQERQLGFLDGLFKAPKPKDQPREADRNSALTELARHADMLRTHGDLSAARTAYQELLELDGGNLYAMFWLASLAFDAAQFDAARAWCERGLANAPDQIGLLMQLGACAAAAGDPLLALESYERVRSIDPQVPELDRLLADQYCSLGRIPEGVARFDAARLAEPNRVLLQHSRLFVLNYAETLAPAELAAEHRRWGTVQEARLAPERYTHRSRNAGARLRIGYASPDLRDHAIAFFLEPLLREHDRTRFDICCFHTVTKTEDAVSARLRRHASEWIHLPDATDADVAKAIHDARIDIAVDLAGHSSTCRLLAFARKPAPVQATWLGYLNTTGLASVDYRLTDAHLDPPGATEALHTETLWRLPIQACFDPGDDARNCSDLHANSAAPVTFGAVNSWPKVTPRMKSLWAQILVRTPESRLVLVARGARNSRLAAMIGEQFASLGVAPERIEIHDAMPRKAFFDLLRTIDLGLDTYPYGGGTTTLHSLWMGVPVVTLAGHVPFARNAVGPLTELGLAHCIANAPEEYVRIATDLARAPDALRAGRQALRASLARSRIMDANGFARSLEAAYAAMWRERGSGESR